MNDLNQENQFQEEEINLQDIWRVIRNSRWLILWTAGIIFFITIIITIITPPVYKATTTVMLKESAASAGSFVFDLVGTQKMQELKNETEVLTSYSLNNAVLRELIHSGEADSMMLFNNKYIRKRYRVRDALMPEWLQGEPEPPIAPKDLSFVQLIRITENLKLNTDVSTVRDADILKIAVSSNDSVEAITLSNAIADKYRLWDMAGGRGEIQFILTFLDSQIQKYEKKLIVLEEKLKTFQIKNQIYALEGQAQLLLEELTKYEGVYYTNQAELEVTNKRLEYLKSQLSDSEKALMDELSNTNNPKIMLLRQKIAEVETQRVENIYVGGIPENSPQIKGLDKQIKDLKAQLVSITSTLVISGSSENNPFQASQELYNKIIEQEVNYYALETGTKQYKLLVEKFDQRLETLPNNVLDYARLERERKLNENLYLTMKQKYEESRITEAGQVGKVRILDAAIVAPKEKPNVKLNLLLGIVLGFGAGIGLAFVREFFDDSVKSVEELEKKHLTILGIIPILGAAGTDRRGNKKEAIKKTKGGQNFKERLITHLDPRSPISEAYRSLRTNVTYSSVDKKIKSLAISSAQPGEGKSTTIANLAIAFAQLKKKTLLLDGDLRRPIQHNVFEVERVPGLSEYLTGDDASFDSFVQKTDIDNLWICTAGNIPPNPSELLGSQKMSALVDKLEHEWDMILIDLPPIIAVTDAAMISNEIDALILLVRSGHTSKGAIDRALDALKNVNAPLTGTILNGAEPEKMCGKYG